MRKRCHALVHERLSMLRSSAEIAHLAATHSGLVQELNRARSPYAPTARELMRGVERLAGDPALSVDQATDALYALHRSFVVQGTQGASGRGRPALATLANLLKPGEAWRVVAAAHAGPRGRTQDQLITVNSAASEPLQQAQVVWQLLRTEPQFATPLGRNRLEVLGEQFAAAALRYPALAAAFGEMRAQLPSAQGPSSDPQARSVRGAVNAPETRRLDRRGMVSGLMNHAAAAPSVTGWWTPYTRDSQVMFATQYLDRFAADGTLYATIEAAAPPPADPAQPALASMVLQPQAATYYGRRPVMELLAPTGQQPANVTLTARARGGSIEVKATAHPQSNRNLVCISTRFTAESRGGRDL